MAKIWCLKSALKPLVAYVAVRSKAVVLLFLIYCFMYSHFFWGFRVGLCFGMHDFVSFYFCNHLVEEEGAGCFVFIVFRMSCHCSVTCPYTAGTQFQPRHEISNNVICATGRG